MVRGALRPGMLVLADRYFSGHPQVAQVIAAGADLVFRAQNNRHLPVFKELSDGSYLSVLSSANLPTKGADTEPAMAPVPIWACANVRPGACGSGSSTPSPSTARPAPSPPC